MARKKKRTLDKQTVFNRAVPINILGIILCALIYTISFLIYRSKYRFTDQIADVFVITLLIINPILYSDFKNAKFNKKLTQIEKEKMTNIFNTTIYASEAIYILKLIFQIIFNFKIINFTA